jgi:hypothetical protein
MDCPYRSIKSHRSILRYPGSLLCQEGGIVPGDRIGNRFTRIYRFPVIIIRSATF